MSCTCDQMSQIFASIKGKWCELSTIYNEWHTFTPTRKWLMFHNLGRKFSKSIGVRVYADAKIKWYSYSMAVLVAVYFSLATYTFYYYAKDGQILEGLKCWSISGLYISVCVSLFFFSPFLCNLRFIQKLIFFFLNHNCEYRHLSPTDIFRL